MLANVSHHRADPRVARRATALVAALAVLLAACGSESSGPDAPAADGQPFEGQTLTIYSGRNEELVGDVFTMFTEATGINVEVRYGNTAELAATILEEGQASPADVFYAQDAGALGALQAAGRFVELPTDVLDLVDPRSRSSVGTWVGVTGRVRVLAYNTSVLTADEVPDSVFDLTDPVWRGRVGWAPTNGSFQAFVTAMRQEYGEDTTRQWLEDLMANDPVEFPNNTSAVDGVGRGEVEVALVNHYYLFRFLAEDPAFPVANKYLPGDIGGLNNVAGVGVLDSSDQHDAAYELVRFLLSEAVQTYHGQVTSALEFPLRLGVESPDLPSLEVLDPPAVDLDQLADLEATLALLRSVGAFE